MCWGLFVKEQRRSTDRIPDTRNWVEKKIHIQQKRDWGTNVPQPNRNNQKAQKALPRQPKREWRNQNETSQETQQDKPW